MRRPVVAIGAMSAVVVVSNLLVHAPVNDWLTWAAFTYPVSFLVTDLSNRVFGPARAARVVLWGFAVGVMMSAVLADWTPFSMPRAFSETALLTAVASGSAFLAAQLLDILIFRVLRRSAWWRAPLISSAVASAVDTLIFFWLLFGVFFPEWGLDWVRYGVGDYAVKASMALALLVPYRVLMGRYVAPSAAASVRAVPE